MQSQQHDTRHDYDGYTSTSYPGDDERQYALDDGRYQSSQPTGSDRQGYPMPGGISYSHRRSFYQPPLERGTLAAVFCYSFGWLSGLLFLLFGGSNRFIRFHALQSLLFFGGINVIDFIAVFGIGRWHLHYLNVYMALALLLLNFIAFVGWLVAMVQAARGASFKLPVAGNIAEAMVGQSITVK